MDFNQSLSEWAKDKPLSILQLDPADRAVLKIADERDAIQKKTFTKWVNKHLKKHWRYVETYTCLHVCYSCRECSTSSGNRHIEDLFEDIRDGHNLISLLEVLAAEILPREKGRLRFHMLQNVQTVLDFLKFKKIKLVNIRPEDIVDGNPKLTLGLIWTIILHFQISDIITGLSDESVTAREALLRWAQRTTERYPGVRVVDFTNSWKDGLAFNAILHRNRPDILDFRSLRTRAARDNLENAFCLAEKEFGITRLLDPEDVDTPEPDEKSIITYISSVYDVFPDPPALHPFMNDEKRQKVEEYKELAISLQMWMQESLVTFKSRNFPNTVAEMKALLNERSRFRSDDIPKRIKDKQKLCQLHNEIQKLAKETGRVTFEGDLSLDSIEKRWNQILPAYQENEVLIREEISRLEKLQKVADKINREAKMCDVKLDDIEKKISEEEKRIQRLYTVDAKHNCDQIETSLKSIEECLKAMKKDVKVLAEGHYYQTVDTDKRIHVIYERYISIRTLFQSQLLLPLSTKTSKIEEKKPSKQRTVNNENTQAQKGFDSNKAFNLLKEHIEWIEKKNKRLHDLDSGMDLQSVKSSFEQHKNEHKSIESYKRKIDQCSSQKNNYTGEHYVSYCELLTQLEKSYSELLAFSSAKLQDIETLMDFVQSVTKELKWIAEKEEIEVSRDWSAKNLNLAELESYQETFTSELEKREIQLNAIQNRGESLLLQKHSSSKCIEDHISLLQDQWSWLLQLTLCLETHLKHAQSYYQFFKEAKECEQMLKKVEERLQTSFSRIPNSVDEGEKTLKQMHLLREEFSGYSDIILSVIKQSSEIVPLKQRRQSVSKPIDVKAICKYKQPNVCIAKDEKCILLDNSHRTKWKISNSSIKEAVVPSVCFIIPRTCAEATEFAESMKKKYDAIIALWTSKEQKLRQNLIIATIRVVKSWDLTQFRTMEISQRESIIHALNEDTQKLLNEGSGDESTLQKLKQEMEHCNQLYHSLIEKLSSDDSQKSLKSSGKKVLDEISSIQLELSDKEKVLKGKLHESITWNLDALENLVIEHKEFEMTLRSFEEKIKEIKQMYSTLSKKSVTCQTKFDALLCTWDELWKLSNLYVERLKALEICIHAFTEATQVVSNFEVQLASFDNMPSDMDNLKRVYERLMCLQTETQQHQNTIDAVSESLRNVKNLIHRTRPKQITHSDLKKFENDFKKLNVRWENVSLQLVERLRSCSASSELLRTYKNKIDEDNTWASETTVKVNSLQTIKTMTTKEVEMQVEPVMNLYSSIAERNSSFELTNILGARYIREAKIYDLRLKHYKENLEEEHPSLDASLLKRAKLTCGADTITCELDCLNQTYEKLMRKVLDYLEELKESFSMHNKHKLCSIISKAVPPSLETFRTVIDQAPALNLMEVDHYSLTASEGKSPIIQDEQTVVPESFKLESYQKDMDLFNSNQIKGLNNVAQTSQVSEKGTVINFQPFSMPSSTSQENICIVKGIFNLETQTFVTLQMAIKQGIINIQEEEFTDLRTKIKMSISDAVDKGYIDNSLFGRLSSKCGIFYPDSKEELSLLEAIQRNLYDLNYGMLCNPLEGTRVTLTDAFHIGIIKKAGIRTLIEMGFIKVSELTISEAVQKEYLDPNTGIFRDPLTNLSMNFSEAINKGFISTSETNDFMTGITLAEALDKSLLDDAGQIVDEDSGEKFNIREAVSNGFLNSSIKEVVNLETSEIHSIEDAILNGILDIDTCRYIDKKMNLHLNLQEARKKQLIFRPLTINEALEKNAIDDCGLVVTPFKKEKLSIIGAIANGILDAESKCIVHPQSHELLSLPEALKHGILSPSGKFWDPVGNKELSMHEAKKSGYVTSVYYKNIFDIECIKDVKSGNLISFKEALNKEIIDVQKDEYMDNSSLRKMSLKEAVSEEYIQDQIYEMLTTSIGVKNADTKNLCLLDCIKYNIFDIETGRFSDPSSKKLLYLKEAIQNQIITSEGASILKGLFNIKMTTATITKYINSQNINEDSDNNIKIFENYPQTDDFSLTPESAQTNYPAENLKYKFDDHPIDIDSMPSIGAFAQKSENDNFGENISYLDQLNIEQKCDFPKILHSKAYEQEVLFQVPENIKCETNYKRVQKKSPDNTDMSDFKIIKNTESTHTQLHHDPVPIRQLNEICNQHVLPEHTNSGVEQVNKSIGLNPNISSKNVSTLSISSETLSPAQSFCHIHVLELPPNGWYLKEAIEKRLFDPECGMFTVPGTDRLLSFEEAVKMEIINKNSAKILESKTSSFISLSHALVNGILNSIGQYIDATQNLNISMKDAIEKQMILLDDRICFENSASTKSVKTLQFIGLQNQDKVSSLLDEQNNDTVTQSQDKTDAVLYKDLNTSLTKHGRFEILPGVFYNSEEFVILNTHTGEKVQLLQSLLTDNSISSLFRVLDVSAGEFIKFQDAIQNKLVDPSTGDYCSPELNYKIPFKDAVLAGYIAAHFSDVQPDFTHINSKDMDKNYGVPRSVNENFESTSTATAVTLISNSTETKVPKTSEISENMHETLTFEHLPNDFKTVQETAIDKLYTNNSNETEVKVVHVYSQREEGKSDLKMPAVTASSLEANNSSVLSDESILFKMPRISLPLDEGVKMSLIDEKTAANITDAIQVNNTKECLRLQDALDKNILDGNTGAITDFFTSETISINEAINRGILDSSTGRLLIPVGHSLSISEAYKQGLIEPSSQRIIHPEHGTLLNLQDAILCDIIDPTSLIIIPQTQCIASLKDSISSGVINAIENIVNGSRKSMTLSEAAETENIFKSSIQHKYIPPLALTFPIALQHNLINISKREFIHPVTKEKYDINEAIDNHMIMVIPKCKLSNSVLLNEALNKNLINPVQKTFKHPVTEEVISIYEAVDKGILIIKSETTDYPLVESSLQLPSVEQEITLSSPTFETSLDILHTKTNFHEDVDIPTIQMNENIVLLNSAAEKYEQEISISPDLKSIETVTSLPKVNTDTSLEGTFLSLYESETDNFVDPFTKKHATFQELIENNSITENAYIYDKKAKTTLSLKDALKENIIDCKTGKYVDKNTGQHFVMREALQLGLLAILGAPLIAGAAVISSVDLVSKQIKVSDNSTFTTDSEKDKHSTVCNQPKAAVNTFAKHKTESVTKTINNEPIESHVNKMHKVPSTESTNVEYLNSPLRSLDLPCTQHVSMPHIKTDNGELEDKQIDLIINVKNTDQLPFEDVKNKEENQLHKTNSLDSQPVELPIDSIKLKSMLKPSYNAPLQNPNRHEKSDADSSSEQNSNTTCKQTIKSCVKSEDKAGKLLELIHESDAKRSVIQLKNDIPHKSISNPPSATVTDNQINKQSYDECCFLDTKDKPQEFDEGSCNFQYSPSHEPVNGSQRHFNIMKSKDQSEEYFKYHSSITSNVIKMQLEPISDKETSEIYSKIDHKQSKHSSTEELEKKPLEYGQAFEVSKSSLSEDAEVKAPVLYDISHSEDDKFTYISKELHTFTDTEKEDVSLLTSVKDICDISPCDERIEANSLPHVIKSHVNHSDNSRSVKKSVGIKIDDTALNSEKLCDFVPDISSNLLIEKRSDFVHSKAPELVNEKSDFVLPIYPGEISKTPNVTDSTSSFKDSPDSLFQVVKELSVKPAKAKLETVTNTMESALAKTQFPNEDDINYLPVVSVHPSSFPSNILHPEYEPSPVLDISDELIPEKDRESSTKTKERLSFNQYSSIPSSEDNLLLPTKEIASKVFEMEMDSTYGDIHRPIDECLYNSPNFMEPSKSSVPASLQSRSRKDGQLPVSKEVSSLPQRIAADTDINDSNVSISPQSDQGGLYEEMFPKVFNSDNRTLDSIELSIDSNEATLPISNEYSLVNDGINTNPSKLSDLNIHISSNTIPSIDHDSSQYSVATNAAVESSGGVAYSSTFHERSISVQDLYPEKGKDTSIIPCHESSTINFDTVDPNNFFITVGSEKTSLEQALRKGLITRQSIIKVQNNDEVILVGESNENLKHDSSEKLPVNEIQENYKTCKENTSNLLQWMAEIETRLSNLGLVKEDLSSLQHQINCAKVLKDDLENQQHLVNTCLDQLRQLIQKGLEILSKEEIHELQKDLQSVKRRYDILINECDRLLRRLVAALEELQKFKSELSSFKEWLNSAQREYNEKEKCLGNLKKLAQNSEAYRIFASDVIAHQADLRFIAMAAQKFLDESKDYLKTLNMLRVNLSKSSPNLEPLESEVKMQVQEISALFHNLLNSVNKLSDHYVIVHNKHRYYIESFEKANSWFRDAKISGEKLLKESISAEPSAVQEQLDFIKTLNMEVVGQGRLIENSVQSGKALIECLDSLQIKSAETQNVQVIVSSLQKDYQTLVNGITLKIKELQTALIHSQDVQDGLDRLLRWLDETENCLRNQSKPVSLIVEKLDEQVQEFKILQSDINNQKQSIDTIDIPSKELMNSNAKSAKTVESKLKDIIARYGKVCEKVNKREQLLEEISTSVRMFETISNQFEEWTSSMQDRIESHDVSQQLNVDGFASVIEYTMNQQNAKQNEYEDMIKIGKNLIVKRDVTDSLQLKEKIKNLEHVWKNLGALLSEKQSFAKARSEQLAAYEIMRGKVVEWISKMETTVDNSEPISLDQVILKKQLAEIKPLLKEYSDYSGTIEKLINLGHSYEVMIKGERDSPRRKMTSPVKKQSSPTRKSPSKGKSPDSAPTSPVKNQLSTQSPLSTVSSGFSSRRSSTENFSAVEDHSQIQLQISEINHRYSLLGSKLSDRSQEINQMNDELKLYTEVIKSIKAFLEAKEKQLPKESLPSSKEQAEKYLKLLKGVQDDMMEKQSEMDNFRIRAKEILHSKIDVKGASELQCQVTELEEKWSKIWTTIKKQILFLQDLKDFQDAQVLLSSWLSQREKMFLVLGPIASEPRMVSSQVQQVQVMKDEFSSQKSLLDRLNQSGTAIIQHLESINANTKKVTEQMENIHYVWADLVGKLEERDKNLEAACGVAKHFYKNHSQIQEKLQKLSDSFDQLFELNTSVDEQLKKLIGLEEQLEKLRPLLADIDAICDQLCDILNDAASKNDIRNKVNALEKTYANLYKKLNNKKAELESCVKEDENFYKSCDDVQVWLNKTDALFSSELKFSADVDKLKTLAQNYEPTYKAVMNKEHELHLLISRGTDMIGKLIVKQEQKNLSTKLDAIQKQWNKLKKTAIDRRNHIHCCLDNCQKYHETSETFIPWLEASEIKMASFKPLSLQRAVLSKQIKELQSFKNDLTKHIQEFENLQQLGDILITTCAIDKEFIRTQIDQLRKKWDELNQNISMKIQTFEDLSLKIIEYKEKLRDVQHTVQRLEDKLSSHDAIGNASHDPIVLNRLKSLHKEATALEKNLISVKEFSQVIMSKAGSSTDASEILKDLENTENKLHTLIKTLDDRCSNLATATKIISTFMTQVKSIVSEIENFSERFDQMSPLARNKNALQQQMIEIKEFTTKLIKIQETLKIAENQCSSIISEGYVTEPKSFKDQVSSLQKQVVRYEEHIKVRKTSIESILSKLERFDTSYSETRRVLETIIKEEKAFQFIGGDVDSIRTQQQKFKIFRSEKIQPLCKLLDECNKMGQGIIQSAAPGVNTNELEQNLENLNESWNSLQERINEREKKLDVALLQSGKFQEAISGVQKWLIDTEEMVTNQKAPSADFKVVKAQVQEQKFLKKMLLDRQNSVMSLKVMGAEFMQSTVTKKEQEQVDSQMSTIIERFDELRASAEERMSLLEKTVPGTQELQDIFTPLNEWLEQTDKKLIVMSTIPVETELVKKKIIEHKKIHDDIVSHKKQVEKLKEVSGKLKKLIGKDEAQFLEQKVKTVTSKFFEITETSSNLSKELTSAEKGVSVFTEKYEKIVSWIEKTTVHVSSFQVFSIDFDKLQDQVKNLKKIKDSINKEQANIDVVLTSGQDIMKHASGEDTIHIKGKLDTLSIKFTELSNRMNERLKLSEDALPLVQSFYDANSKISTWLDSAEKSMKTLESVGLNIQQTTIQQLQSKIQEFRCILETLNHTGPRICQLSPGNGSTTIENMMSKANHRFEALSELVQRKAERIELAVQRKFDVVGDIEELLDWFKEIESQVNNAEGLSPEPNSLSVLLKQQKAVSDEVNSQKARVRDILTSAKKLMRESSSEDLSFIREKAESLKTISNDISSICQDRLSIIEQALPLAEHFFETHSDLGQWLEVAEGEAELLEAPALNAIQIKKQQDRNKGLVQSVHEHKPLVDKLNKTGSALTKLCKDEETERVDIILESDNSRYNALRQILREHQSALEEALQATSQFSDKLEGMLSALTSTADQIQNAEPISAHPERIQEQINDNKAVLQDLEKRTSALEAVRKAADDVIVKASSIDEPAVRDIKKKLDRLNDLWDTIQTAARNRGKSLEEALVAAEKFWDELTAVMKALKELQDNLNNQESPAVEPNAVQQQQEVLQEIKQEITQTKPEVDHCRQAGQDLMQLCGEPDKPEVKKHIEDLDSVWENVTTLYAKREQNLIDAMEKAMNFHDILQNLLEFLDAAEQKFSDLGAVSADIDTVKKQILQLKEFKTNVDPHMVEVESLNRQAQELVERTSPDQSLAIREPLDDINKRWDDLLKGIVDRQQEMENALLKLGQFQHALDELIIWISKTENVLDDLKPVFGDPQVIEVVLAKHKVLTNDIQAHEVSIETINRAARQLIEKDDSEDAKSTQNKLKSLNIRWEQLQEKSSERQRELEEALKEAMQFHQEIQDLLILLSDIDGHLVTSKPVGGLPETAREQLNRFMDIYAELDSNRHKVENVLQQGQSYLKRSGESSTKKLQHSLQTLRQRWENVLNKANDRKIKLEIALREATEFHEALQSFVEWLTNAEKYLTGLKPVSRYMNTVLEQIEDHRNFQKDIGAHREVMLNLDKKGTHLKYFSQKQDVILIKNLLISVQHRWEKVISKAAERTRSLDHGYKEAKEFHDAWTSLSTWLDEAEKTLDSITHIGNDPLKIKQLLNKHKEFQRILGSKQTSFDTTMRIGRTLKDRCPKQDVPVLQEMMDELKSRWNRVCSKSVDRQRKLEEALLYSGQFKEAVQALMDWLDKAILKLSDTKLYHGDLDTVTTLMEQHKTFEDELKSRGRSLETIRKTAKDLKESSSPEDSQKILMEVEKLEVKWKQISDISDSYRFKLDDALKQAENLHKNVHILLEWLSDAEMKLRFVGPLPEDEETTKNQIAIHQEFLKEMEQQEINKNNILETAQEILKKCHPDGISVIRHWITIIQSRWEEIAIWARQRDQRLKDHLRSLKDIMELLEELLKWLTSAETTLTTLEAEPLPDDLPTLERLIKEHQIFMDDMSKKKQPDVEKVTKAFSSKREVGKVLPQLPVKDKNVKDRATRGSTPSPIKTSTPLKQQGDSDIKHPKVRLLLDKWHTVWVLAMERQRRLQDKYNYLLEFERIKNFDFNEWRKRYLGWMNNKKSRIMDQFRKIDKNNDGKVTKQEFIDGILRSKFTTSRLEMERVADIFDINGDGFIDTKEYIDTLRPDRESGPQTDAEKIQDEVQRQVAKCTCVHRFKVYQVGEGKYRFGDSQKLRLVRILRSTVMVRVGGGWVALDEFLVKNDPCRGCREEALKLTKLLIHHSQHPQKNVKSENNISKGTKGRTNLELREQFILADGVSQSMAPFKPKPSPNSSVSSQSGASFSRSGNSIPSAGPITKIREKSERSTPMHQGRSSADTSSDISGPSLSEMDSSSNKSGLSRVSPSVTRLSSKTLGIKPSSRPSSRQGSRPSSRAPSDLSQDGVDDYKKSRKAQFSSQQNAGLGVKSSAAAMKSTSGAGGSKIPSAKRTPPKISVTSANEKSKKDTKK